MNTVFYIAKRYAFSKSKTKAINIITRISTIGIVVSSMALFVVLSVFSGLENFALSFANMIDPDLVVLPSTGKKIAISEQQEKELERFQKSIAFSKVIEDRVIFTYGEKQIVAFIKAVDANYTKTVAINEHIAYGQWLQSNTNDAVLGNGLANEISAGMYSNEKLLEVFAMKPGKGMITMPDEAYTKLPLYPSGIYSLENMETDNKYIYTDISVGRDLLHYKPNEVSKIELKLLNAVSEKDVIANLQKIFPNTEIKNRAQLNEGLYKMLKTESLAIYLIFTLIIIVTLFCLTGSLIMIILEKKEHIKTLFDMGFTQRKLQQIFLYQGLILAVSGIVVGLTIGVVITLLQQHFGFVKISENFPYPIVFSWQNGILVVVTLLVLSIIASFIAASRINNLMNR
ncbi:FtsX-like permease family protein [Flavobacterium sp. CBA20B-1]|uniref:ABC transporter permease n=1 Tax=unclassified Flavobacterium TaxID=196869 RepID=UPI00222447A7|nr:MULTISPECIES: FtsX-like permease family protein [unclassified Flavobacterium]WCM42548.1 FtsX-like permease family protein [Flavobacterium sp. CBA20B-1]